MNYRRAKKIRIYDCEMDTGCLKTFPCLAKTARHGASPGEVAETIAKNRMRPEGQPPSDRIIRVFLSRHRLPRRRRHECYSQHLPARGAACAEARFVDS